MAALGLFRRILIARAVLGSVGLAVAAVSPHMHGRASVVAISGLALVSSLLTWPFGEHLRQVSACVLVTDSVLAVAALVGVPAAGVEVVFAWPVVFSCFAFGGPWALRTAAGMAGITFAAGLWVSPGGAGRGLATAAMLVAFGWLISRLCAAQHSAAADLERKSSQLQRLSQLATRMASLNEAEAVMSIYLDAARELAGADSAGFIAVRQGMCEIIAGSGMPDWLVGYRYPPDKGVTGRVVRYDRSIVLNDYQAQPSAHPLFKMLGYTAEMTVPLPKSAPIVGALSVGRRSGDAPFSDADVEVVEALAGHAAGALQRGSALKEERRLREELEELNRQKDEFLTVVSHELRTPLTVLTGILQTLEMRGPRLGSTTQQDMMRRARGQADRLHRLIVRLLDLSRVSGERRPRPRAVDLRCVVELAIEGSRVAETCPADVEDLTVLADPDDLELAIRNLVENAAKYGGGCVRVHGSAVGGRALVAVEDDGPGVDPGDEKRLFDRFFRGGESQGEPGLGVGLALVKESVERMDGSVWYEAREEGGSRFVISLSLVPQLFPKSIQARTAVGSGV